MALGAIALISGLSIFLFYRQRIRKNKKITDQQQELSSQRIQQLEQQQKISNMSTMIEGQEAERRRIAKDLHDGLGGLLATVSTQMAQIQSNIDELASIDLYQSANHMIDQACDEVRRISHNMMPGVLRLEGLQGALEEIIDQLQSVHDMQVDSTIDFEESRLDESQSHMLYRITQELINNVVKHSRADLVLLQFIGYDDHLNVLVEDNGIGYNTKEVDEGLGLRSIQSRVDYLGGDIDVHTSTGSGVSISINIPWTITG